MRHVPCRFRSGRPASSTLTDRSAARTHPAYDTTRGRCEAGPPGIARRAATKAAGVGLLAWLVAAAAPPPVDQHFAPWIDGTAPTEPTTQVQRIDADTYVIRQSVRTNFEAPFLYLLFGKTRAMLIDTGAGGLAIRPPIEALITEWRSRHGGRPVRLVVAHSHGHGDHHAGDAEFRDRPDTDVVGLTPAAVAAFFAIRDWPDGIGRYDLGDRVIAIVPTPGHEPAHVMFYDARTRLLFSGDMLYPGRLYVPAGQQATFRASSGRLAAFARTHPIRALLGAHVEMTTTAGKDYPMAAKSHPGEHPLALPPSAIQTLRQTVERQGAEPRIDRQADFILYPLPPKPAS